MYKPTIYAFNKAIFFHVSQSKRFRTLGASYNTLVQWFTLTINGEKNVFLTPRQLDYGKMIFFKLSY